MPTSTLTARNRQAFGSRIRNDLYDRHRVNDPQGPLVAQVLVMRGAELRMSVREAQDAMDLDFRNTVTRSDLPHGAEYRARPGHHLSDVLHDLRDARRPAIVFNGNNVGWWGNQFVIRRGQLRFKPKGPIFDDGFLAEHTTGRHAFFSRTPAGFRITDFELFGSQAAEADEIAVATPQRLPRCGLSGFPLIRRGRPVWKEHGEHAWDPGLLFNVTASREHYPLLIRDIIRHKITAREELARHPMTVIGLDEDENVVLLVVEKSERSRGMTVAEADRLLRRRFGVQDAIVLGAAGDAQLATTAEGFLTIPYVASYARSVARSIPPEMQSGELSTHSVWARPVPCYVLLRPSSDTAQATLEQPLPRLRQRVEVN